jgi:hypothetical protein
VTRKPRPADLALVALAVLLAFATAHTVTTTTQLITRRAADRHAFRHYVHGFDARFAKIRVRRHRRFDVACARERVPRGGKLCVTVERGKAGSSVLAAYTLTHGRRHRCVAHHRCLRAVVRRPHRRTFS